jgi:hypothetical protein
MIDVNTWVGDYEALVIQENSKELSEQETQELKTKRFQLFAILWGKNLK